MGRTFGCPDLRMAYGFGNGSVRIHLGERMHCAARQAVGDRPLASTAIRAERVPAPPDQVPAMLR